MFQTRTILLACIAFTPLSTTVHAGFLTTGTATTYAGNTRNNVITQAFNLNDGATETVLDSFDLHVKGIFSNTYHGVFFELETGTAKIISRTNLASATVTGAHDGLVSFAVNQALDVTKTYGIGLYSDNNGEWGIVNPKSSDPQWTNHTYWQNINAVAGNSPQFGAGHDWSFDFAANLHLSAASAAVPEPASLAMWSVMGGTGFLVRRRRKKTIAS